MAKIAFCPTMKPYAETIGRNVEGVEMYQGSAAAEVLAMLRYGQVDGVLIGRRAKEYEIDGETEFKKLKGGLTLVYMQKAAIDEGQLTTIPVKTYLDRERIGDLAKSFKSIEWRNSFGDCFKDGLEIPAIIDWDDYKDQFELLIPMNRQGKTPVFRAPVLYYKNIDEEIMSEIKEVIGD